MRPRSSVTSSSPAVGNRKSGAEPEQRRLPGSVRPGDEQEAVARELEPDAAQNALVAVALLHPPGPNHHATVVVPRAPFLPTDSSHQRAVSSRPTAAAHVWGLSPTCSGVDVAWAGSLWPMAFESVSERSVHLGPSWTGGSAFLDRTLESLRAYGQGVPRIPRYVCPDGIFHVATRGVAKMPIYRDDDDRRVFLGLLGPSPAKQYEWTCHAFCLMTNHYHLVLDTTREEPLRRHCRLLNGRLRPRLQRQVRTLGARVR